jgi:putative inorganic carbon (hco3(-)) transporter
LERVSRIPPGISSAPPRRVWRPPRYAWLLLWLIGLAATCILYPQRLHGGLLIAAPFVLAAGVLLLRRLWELHPAWTLCAAIALAIFSNGWSLIGLGGLPPPNRLLILVVLLQFAFRVPGVESIPRPQVRNVHLLMCFTVIYASASAVAAGTLTSNTGFFPLVDILGAVPFLLFFLAPSIFSGQRERDLLLATLVGLGLYLGTTSIFESVGPHSLVFPPYIVQTDQVSRGLVQASGPFQSPVAQGFAVFACAVASLIAVAQWRSRRGRYIAALSCLTCTFACFATLERGVWLAAVLAAIVTAAATRRGRRWLLPAALACAIGVGAVLTLSAQLSQQASQRANYQQSVWDRQNQTTAGLRMVEAKPLIGFGWDRYRSRSEEYFRQASDYPMVGYTSPGAAVGLPRKVYPLHDTYLSYAVELGLIGLVLWMASLLLALLSAITTPGPPSLRPWKLGLLAIAVFFLIVSFFDPHEQSFPIMLLLLWAGVASGRRAPLGRSKPAGAIRLTPDREPRPALLSA